MWSAWQGCRAHSAYARSPLCRLMVKPRFLTSEVIERVVLSAPSSCTQNPVKAQEDSCVFLCSFLQGFMLNICQMLQPRGTNRTLGACRVRRVEPYLRAGLIAAVGLALSFGLGLGFRV